MKRQGSAVSSRRSFLKLGLFGGLALAGVGGIYRLSRPAATMQRYALDADAKAALSAIVPAILQDAIQPTPQSIASAISAVQSAIAALPLVTQKEIQDLFSLLAFGPTRRILAGVSDDWATAKPTDVATFLQNWRTHRFATLNSAYQAMHDLVIGSWYADHANWKAIGYPGPMAQLS